MPERSKHVGTNSSRPEVIIKAKNFVTDPNRSFEYMKAVESTAKDVLKAIKEQIGRNINDSK